MFGFFPMLILYLVGMADDLIGVKYRAKFFAQILCAGLLIVGGTWVNNFHGIIGIYNIVPSAAIPFTVLLIVFIINAINLIDGIDGLASGLSGIATLIYGVIFLLIEDYLCAILSFATLGVLIPFFYGVLVLHEKNIRTKLVDLGILLVSLALLVIGS